MKIVNKKAYFDYFVVEEYICGLVLQGSEVKSLRQSDVNFNDGYIIFKDGELFIKNMRIAKYKEATYNNHEEMRDKKLLLTKREITKISKSYDERGITVIPLELFTLKNRFKLKIGVCRGKKNWDKRNSIKEKDLERELRNGINL
jgi:SsrA-binding protein